jgi:flagellar hook-basal body complex protein FliE
MQYAIEAISAITSTGGTPATGLATGLSGTPGSEFANVMAQSMAQVNSDIASAEASMAALARGEAVELHDVMISMEKARISAMAMVQIRNRLVEAYQDVTRMQV